MSAARRLCVKGVAISLAIACAAYGNATRCVAGLDEVSFSDQEVRRILQHSPLPDPPSDPSNGVETDPRAARLGQFLFFDPRLSRGGSVSCATCHIPEQGFADRLSLSQGEGRGERHTMSLVNVAHQRWFFWDGRAATLWSQALGPIERASEMDGSRVDCARLVTSDAELKAAYEAVFGPAPDVSDPTQFPAGARPATSVRDDRHLAWEVMTPENRDAVNLVFANVGKALAAYQRRIMSGAAPFDRFADGLRSNDRSMISAISPEAQRGAKLFVGRADCRSCHSGPTFTDGEFHNTGVPPLADGPQRDAGRFAGIALLSADPFFFAQRFSDDGGELHRFKVEGLVRSAENLGQFKTPSLRGVAETAPYMHQGQLATLTDVLQFYSTLEGAVLPTHHSEAVLRPLNLTDGEIADLLAFLQSLTGSPVDPTLLSRPESPRLPSEEGSPMSPP
jgi:cytochrome c peroxidase